MRSVDPEWVFFVAYIAIIPVFAWRASYRYAALFIGIVALEVAALALNGRRCPLTDLATRYTDDRRDNFDIYLPEWLARHNKLIFGALYVAGIVLTLLRWNGGDEDRGGRPRGVYGWGRTCGKWYTWRVGW